MMLPSGEEALLIYGSLLIMLFVGCIFLGVILYINKRLNAEQREQTEMEKRAASVAQNGHPAPHDKE